MTARVKSSLWLPLFLLVTIMTLASGDPITTSQCKSRLRAGWQRVRWDNEDKEGTTFQLDSCNLTSVSPSEDFHGLPNVGVIVFSYNDIVHVNTSTFIPVPGVTDIDFDHNKLLEPPIFVEHSCPNLTALNFEHNLITGISNANTFTACDKLEKLDLSYNNIVDINPSAFNALTNLLTLYLSYNKIEYIPDQLFANNAQLIAVSLNDNRLTQLSHDFITNLKHTSPNIYAFEINHNPWQCSCLLEVVADAQRLDIEWYTYMQSELYEERSCAYDGKICSRQVKVLGNISQ